MQSKRSGIRRQLSTLDLSIVRQHTPVQLSIDSDAELLCVQVIGDHSMVLLGLTLGGAEMFIDQIRAGVDQLVTARSTPHGGVS